MKNLIIAAIALIAVLCSFTYSNREGGKIKADAEQMEKLHYCGHTYICYRFYATNFWSQDLMVLAAPQSFITPTANVKKRNSTI